MNHDSTAQRDIRYFYWRFSRAGLPQPDSANAQAFAERVAIMIADAGMIETEAREAAIAPYLVKETSTAQP